MFLRILRNWGSEIGMLEHSRTRSVSFLLLTLQEFSHRQNRKKIILFIKILHLHSIKCHWCYQAYEYWQRQLSAPDFLSQVWFLSAVSPGIYVDICKTLILLCLVLLFQTFSIDFLLLQMRIQPPFPPHHHCASPIFSHLLIRSQFLAKSEFTIYYL